jgi:hypothetical protein
MLRPVSVIECISVIPMQRKSGYEITQQLHTLRVNQ